MVFKTSYDTSNRIWSGPQVPPTYERNVSLATVILNTFEQDPHHVGQINDNNGVRYTNQEIRLQTIRLANKLQCSYDICKDDVIGLISKNHEHVTAIVFAAFALAAPINPLDPNYKIDEIINMFKFTKPKLIFCETEALEHLNEALRLLGTDGITKIITVDSRVDGVLFLGDIFEPFEDEHRFVPTQFEDGAAQTAIITCSSGTSGAAKGVSLSHALLLEQCKTSIVMVHEDVYLSFSALFWLSGTMALLTGTLNNITRVVTTDTFEADLMLRLIVKYKISILITPPSYIVQMMNSPLMTKTSLSSIRLFYSGGCNVPDDLIKSIKQLTSVDILSAYGMSEVAGLVASNSNASLSRSGTVGMLKSNISIKIIDDYENRLGPLSNGEVCIRHTIPFLGYYRDPLNTSAAFSADGWYHTGDIGHFDEDGYLVLVDRKKDLLFVPEHFAPSELENLLIKCPGVADVCVVGIPDQIRGVDLPAAFVIVVPGQSVSAETLENIVKDALSANKQLRGGVYFVDDFPLTPTGKILRRKLKEMAIEMYNQKVVV